jgi:Spy/CpxP family protein refolding chaperone
MIRSASTLMLALALAAPAVSAQAVDAREKMAAFQAEVTQGKQAYVSRQLSLDSAEQAAFWPVYDKMQEALAELAERRRENAAAYVAAVGNAADEGAAEDVAEEAVAIEIEQAELLERAYKDLSRDLGAREAMAYVQIEARLATLLRYEVAAASLP